MGLSRLAVESLVFPSLMERIITEFENDKMFETYPSQILFMMALDTCNASVQRDIVGAQTKFDNLFLDSYPGEDITKLATKALQLLHILSGSYALPLNLGSKLLKKLTNTSSEFFNRKMHALLDAARTLETRYRLKDPITMGDNPEYTKYGPYAIYTSLQEEHGRLVVDSDWPALANKPSETNNVTPEEMEKDKIIQCYKCKQWGHKANNPICPLHSKRSGEKSSNKSSGNKRMKLKEA